MRKTIIVAILLLLSGWFCSPPPKSEGEVDLLEAPNTEAIDAVRNEFEDAILGEAPTEIGDLWMEHAGDYLPTDHPTLNGREEIVNYFEDFFQAYSVEDVEIDSTEVDVSEDMAFDRGMALVTVAPRNGAPLISMALRYLTILRKDPNGAWKIEVMITNTEEPSESPMDTEAE